MPYSPQPSTKIVPYKEMLLVYSSFNGNDDSEEAEYEEEASDNG